MSEHAILPIKCRDELVWVVLQIKFMTAFLFSSNNHRLHLSLIRNPKAVFTLRTTSYDSAECLDGRCRRTASCDTDAEIELGSISASVSLRCHTTSCGMWALPLNQCVQLQRHRTTSYDIGRCRTRSCAVWTPLKPNNVTLTIHETLTVIPKLKKQKQLYTSYSRIS